MKKILLFFGLLISTLIYSQYTTPSIDGTININEYGNTNSYVSGTRTWYLTWDATNIYVGVSGHTNFNDAIVLYLDIDPQVPVNGGVNANGATQGTGYDGVTPSFSFRADFFAYVKSGYDDYKLDDGANGWGPSTTGSLGKSFNDGNDVGEFAIPWSAITGSGIPASFNYVAYFSYSGGGGGTFSNVPRLNPTGTTPTLVRYFAVSNTANGAATSPFSQESYCHIAGDLSGFGGIDVYDFTMNVSGKTITRTTGEGGVWEIGHNLVITNGTIDFGSSSDEVIVSNDVYIGGSGSIKLSTAIGGDIYFNGDWTCQGAFTPNNRAVFLTGDQNQAIDNSSSNFDYVIVDKSGGSLDFFGSTISETIDANLTITSGTFEVPAGKSLTITGNLSNSGTFILKSDGTGKSGNPTGSLIVDGTISGNISVQRHLTDYTSPESADGWHFLSSPVASQAISSFDNIGGTDDFYMWDEQTSYWINRTILDGDNQPIINPDFDENFEVGKGYLMAYEDETTKTFSGIPNNAQVVTNLSYSGTGIYKGWNLLGNPFASAIDWDLITPSVSVNGEVHVYDESIGDYISYNGGGDLTG